VGRGPNAAITTDGKAVAQEDTQNAAKVQSDTLVAAAAATHKVMLLNQGTTIADIVASLNEMGATPDDLITLLQSIKAAGALAAEIDMQ
jgi:flagellar P-ring protein precursor FlgI